MATTAQYLKPLLKKYGYRYAHVERFIAEKRMTIDFCGFADVLAFRPYPSSVSLCVQYLGGDHLWLLEPGHVENIYAGVLAIQCCAASSLSEHCDKVAYGRPREPLTDWLLCGNRFEVWGWASRPSKPGSKRRKQIPTVRKFVLHDNEFYYFPTTELTHHGYQIDPRYQT